MKFKVGDKVKGISNDYISTNVDMCLGEVKDVGKNYINILVLDHIDTRRIGKIFGAINPEGRFEIVESKNRKFFKELPNDFTGTLEVEKGYIVKKEILDDVEKEYLLNIIKPFKDKVEYICKRVDLRGEFIIIEIVKDATIIFPTFNKTTMYKGMEVNKKYTLKELGLDE